MNELEILKKELNDLKQWKQSLEASYSIPLNIHQAFSTRLSSSVAGLAVSAKGATSEDRAVNESGSAAYSVLKSPDGFLQIIINGTTYYIPAFT